MTRLKPLNRQNAGITQQYPERVVQFGAGNFLRGFVDWVIEALNNAAEFNSSVVVVRVTPRGTYEDLDAQGGLFHVHLEGIQDGELVSSTQLITCISRTVYPYRDYESYRALAQQPDIRFLISNVTEAGIAYNAADQFADSPPYSFPAKLTQFLYERFAFFEGAIDKGCIIIPTELVVDNGSQLRDMVLQYVELWNLDAEFGRWVIEHSIFCNTLVDRIIPGFPKDRSSDILQAIGYDDKLLVLGEPYHSWVIEAPEQVRQEFPVDKTDLNVIIVDDVAPYRQTKVRILNGVHTSMVPLGYLLGLESVRDCIDHPVLGQFLHDEVYREIIPSMDLDGGELGRFAQAVFDRFRNPAIHHRLLTIAVNSNTKIQTRIVPTILSYQSKLGALPERAVLALAAHLRFYAGEWQGKSIPLSDDETILQSYRTLWQSSSSTDDLVAGILNDSELVGADLKDVPGLHKQLVYYLNAIESNRLLSVIEEINA